VDPLETGATYFVHILPNAAVDCDNSQPVFREWSDIYICVNEPYVFDHSAVDADGDELIYKLCTPSTGAEIDNPIPHLPSNPPYAGVQISNGYTLDNLFGSGSPLTIDPNTGVLTATPGITGTYLVGICVEEYRDGEFFSEVRRDFEINVVACNNPITIDCEVQGSDLCNGGTSVTIQNNTTGADSFLWYFDYPNTDPAFTSTAQNPTFNYPAPGTYTIRLEATRSADNCTLSKETQITVGAVGPKAEFVAIPISCTGDQVSVRFTDSTIGGNSTYAQNWEINGTTYTSSPFVLDFNRNETVTVNYSIETPEGCVSIQNQAINLEDLINSAYFEVDLISCTASGNTIQLTNPSGANTTWTVMDGNSAPYTLSGSTATTTLNSPDFTITMDSDNGCNAAPITESYNINDFIDGATDVQLISCSAAGNIYSFTNTTNANATWTIQDGATTHNLTGDFFTVLISATNFTVTTTFDNSCYGIITNNYNANDFLQADFDVQLVTCSPNGTIFNFVNPAGTVANWTIVDGGNTTSQTGHIISGTITGEFFSVTIDLDNGCSGPYTETFSVEQFKIAPKADFSAIPIRCTGDQVTVRFTDTTISDRNYTQSWNIGGSTFNSSPFELTFDRNETITVVYEISTTDGCGSSIQNQAINLEDLVNSVYFEVDLVSCDANGTIISLFNPSGNPTTWTITDGYSAPMTLSGASVSTTVTSDFFIVSMVDDNGCNAGAITRRYNLSDFYSSAVDVQLVSCLANGNVFSFTNLTNANATWTIQDGNNTHVFDGDFYTALITSQSFTVTTEFDNSCYGTITNTYNTSDFLTPDFDVELITCTDNGTIFNFVNPTGTVANWTIVDGGTTTTQVGHTISGTISGDFFSVTIDLDNGCSGPYTESFDVNQFGTAPKADFSAIPINCTGDQVTVRFIDNTISNVNYTQQWTVEGVSYTTSPFDVTFDRNQTITVEYEIQTTNGCGSSIQNQAINLEDLINSPYFEVDLISCDANGTFISLVNPSGNPTTWTITDGNNPATTLSGSNVTTTVSSTSFTISMVDQNGCNAGPISQTFNLNDFFESAVDVQLVSCLPSGNVFSFTNDTDASATWTIVDGNNTDIFQGDYFTTLIQSQTFTVTTTFDNSCYQPITNTYNASDFLQADFDVELVACTANGTIFNFVNPAGTVANWTVVDGTNTTNQVGHTISGTITGSTFTVTIDPANGCTGPYTETFNTSDLLPGVSIANNLPTDCLDPNGETITLSPQFSGLAGGVSSYSWSYGIAGAAATTSNNPSVSIFVTPGQTVEATLDIEFFNGCGASTTTSFVANGGSGGNISIVNDLNSPCISPSGQTVTFSTSGGGTITAYNWTYNIAGQAQQTATGPSIAVSLMPGQSVTTSVTVTFSDGCMATATETLIPDAAPTPSIQVDEDCSDPTQTVVTLTDVTNLGGLTVTSYQWTVNGTSSNGPSVEFTVANGPVTVSLVVTYSNGCTATYNRTFTPEEYTPTLDYEVETIECIDDMVVLEFTFTGFTPECMDISMINWTINGMMYTGETVQVTLPVNETIDVGLTVTYTNGMVLTATDPSLTSINTGDYINNISVDIENNRPGGCSDSLDLAIVNPVNGGQYSWSTNPDFTNIIGTGPTYMGSDVEFFDGTVYARLDDPSNCTYGTGQISPETNFINLEYDKPFIICPGDTAVFEVSNLETDQTVEYVWKDESGFLLEGGDTSAPTVGVPQDQTEDFFMLLCTSNNFGCTGVDTVRFMISEPVETLDFTWEAVECGSLTIDFMSDNDFGPGNTNWDFGDGNTSMEENPTHTFGMEGTYTVTLSNQADVCAGDDVSQEITLPDLPTVNIDQDTIFYGPAGPAIVEADVSESVDSIVWCLPDTTTMEGNPLEYEPELDTVTVIVKVWDENDCMSQEEVVLVRMFALPEDIDSDSPETVCVNDTFPLSIDFEGNVLW